MFDRSGSNSCEALIIEQIVSTVQTLEPQQHLFPVATTTQLGWQISFSGAARTTDKHSCPWITRVFELCKLLCLADMNHIFFFFFFSLECASCIPLQCFFCPWTTSPPPGANMWLLCPPVHPWNTHTNVFLFCFALLASFLHWKAPSIRGGSRIIRIWIIWIPRLEVQWKWHFYFCNASLHI